MKKNLLPKTPIKFLTFYWVKCVLITLVHKLTCHYIYYILEKKHSCDDIALSTLNSCDFYRVNIYCPVRDQWCVYIISEFLFQSTCSKRIYAFWPFFKSFLGFSWLSITYLFCTVSLYFLNLMEQSILGSLGVDCSYFLSLLVFVPVFMV